MSTKLASVQPGSHAVDIVTEHGHDSFFIIKVKIGFDLPELFKRARITVHKVIV